MCTEESVPAVFKCLDIDKMKSSTYTLMKQNGFYGKSFGEVFSFCVKCFFILYADVGSVMICVHRRKSHCSPLKNLSN